LREWSPKSPKTLKIRCGFLHPIDEMPLVYIGSIASATSTYHSTCTLHSTSNYYSTTPPLRHPTPTSRNFLPTSTPQSLPSPYIYRILRESRPSLTVYVTYIFVASTTYTTYSPLQPYVPPTTLRPTYNPTSHLPLPRAWSPYTSRHFLYLPQYRHFHLRHTFAKSPSPLTYH
jgi:hypothetical protein